MENNVVQINRADQYPVYRAQILGGEVVETDEVGVAYLKSGATLFRLRLWMFPKEQFFVAIDDQDQTKYVLLSLDEYQLKKGEMRRRWSKVGQGYVHGNFIRLKFWLFAEEVVLCLFPKGQPSEVQNAA